MTRTRLSGLRRALVSGSSLFVVVVAMHEAAWGQTGNPLFTARRDVNLWELMFTPPALADMNEDGILDVVSYSGANPIPAIGIYIGNAEGAFSRWSEVETGSLPFAITTGDFNEDGYRDIAALCWHHEPPFFSQGIVMMFIGDGRGEFTLEDHEYAIAPPMIDGQYGPILVADMNQDGHEDLVVQGGRFVYLGTGDGEFGFRENFDLHRGVFVLADFNEDSYPDMAESTDQIMALGNGVGGFGPPQSLPIPTPTSSMATADFNVDGHADLAFASQTTSEVFLLLGIGNGAFQSPVSVPTSDPGFALVAGQFTADAHPDLLITNGQHAYKADLLAGDGAGGFQITQSVVIYIGVMGAVGRIDGDGRDDAVLGLTILKTEGVSEGFIKAERIPVGAGPFDLEAGDFDEDDRVDLAVANTQDNTVLLLHGTDSGSLVPGALIPVSQEPRSIAVGDVDEDGHIDLAIASRNGTMVSIFRGDGQGGMEEHLSIPFPWRPTSVELRDMNHDENLDLVICQFDQANIEVLLGNGQGDFGSPIVCLTPAGGAVDLAVAELNGDEHQDVVLAYQSAGVSVLLGNGSGALTPLPLEGLGQNSSRLAVSQVDGDGIADVVVTGDRGTWLFKGAGNGDLAAPFSLEVPGHSSGVVIADMTGDQANDVAIAIREKNGVTIREGNGVGDFGPIDDYGGGRVPMDLVATDLNRDGHLDLVTADLEGNSVHILLSELPRITAVEDGAPISQPISDLGLASPNPAPRGGVISIAIGEGQASTIRIYDVGGRFVNRLSRTPGSDRFIWSGRDIEGRLVPAGQYFAKPEVLGDAPSVKVSVVQ